MSSYFMHATAASQFIALQAPYQLIDMRTCDYLITFYYSCTPSPTLRITAITQSRGRVWSDSSGFRVCVECDIIDRNYQVTLECAEKTGPPHLFVCPQRLCNSRNAEGRGWAFYMHSAISHQAKCTQSPDYLSGHYNMATKGGLGMRLHFQVPLLQRSRSCTPKFHVLTLPVQCICNPSVCGIHWLVITVRRPLKWPKAHAKKGGATKYLPRAFVLPCQWSATTPDSQPSLVPALIYVD